MSNMNTPDFSVGTEVLGHNASYRVIKKLEGGAYARPYLVENVKNQTRAILKFNTKVNEAEIVKLVSQAFKDRDELPLVVDVVDYPQEKYDGWYGHIEAFAEGKTGEEEAPTELQALQIALQFAHTLKYCAKYGVANLDIKPLTHIFWQYNQGLSKPTIKIIDWNAGTKSATFSQLRKDIIEFCKSLPELFTGQEVQKFKVNPLSWGFSASANAQLPVTYSTWILLTTLSLDWGSPTIPELKDVLRLPNSSTPVEESEKLIVDAWEAISNQIQNAIGRYEKPESQNFVPRYSPPPRLKAQKGFDYISSVLKEKDQALSPERIEGMCLQASEIHHWVLDNINYISIHRSDEEAAMMAMRLLEPGNQQYAILLSAFQIWKYVGYVSSTENDPDWQETIQAIASADFEQLNLLKENKFSTMRERIIEKHFTDIEYIEEWSGRFDSLVAEINIWVILNIGTDSDVLGLSNRHPLVRDRQNTIKQRLSWNEDFENKLAGLEQAYNTADFERMKALVNEIGLERESLTTAQKKQLNSYSNLAELYETIHAAANSWKQEDLLKFDTYYLALTDEQKGILQPYKQTVLGKQAMLLKLESMVDADIWNNIETLNWDKYQNAAETEQYKTAKSYLEKWGDSQLTGLKTSLSNGLKENKFDVELIEDSIARVEQLKKLAEQLSLTDLISQLIVLRSELDDEKTGINNFITQLEAYAFEQRENPSDAQELEALNENQKIPLKIRELLQATPSQHSNTIEDVISTLDSINNEMRVNHSDLLSEINSKGQTTDIQEKLESTGRKKISRFVAFLSLILLVGFSIFSFWTMKAFFTQGKTVAVEILEKTKSIESIQSNLVELIANITPADQSGEIATTEAVEPSSNDSGVVEDETTNHPLQLGLPIFYTTNGNEAFYVYLEDQTEQAIFRTEGTQHLTLYPVENSVDEGDDTKTEVLLFAYVSEERVQCDNTTKLCTVAPSINLFSPNDYKTPIMVTLKEIPDVILISDVTQSADPLKLAGRVILLQAWIENDALEK